MKKFTFNKQFMVLMFLLLNCFASYAADEDLITKQITIKLTEAGTLPNKIASSKKNLVTNLKIIGEINGTDLRFLREMAGRDVNRDFTSGKLSVLDLSEVKIVEGGGYYYSDYSNSSKNYYTTSNDIIGVSAFEGCISLTSVNIPSSVTEIGVNAFKYCSSLTSVNIPSSVTEIGGSAFYSCRYLKSVNIPSSVTKIGEEAFSRCTSLASISIPSSVTVIGNQAFSSCTSLTNVNIPSSVTVIGNQAFSSCTSLTSVNIPSSVTLIEDETFRDCTSLTSVNIPSSVTEIGAGAFNSCTSLTSVNIPSSVTSIGDRAFYSCSGLRSVYVYAETPPSISANAFNGCDLKNCTFYIPKGTYDAYWLSEWGNLENIVEFDATSIHNTVATLKTQETARYAVNGQRLIVPIKGINLVKYSNGTVKKEFVK